MVCEVMVSTWGGAQESSLGRHNEPHVGFNPFREFKGDNEVQTDLEQDSPEYGVWSTA